MSKSIDIELVYFRSTKNKHVYKGPDGSGFEAVYVSKETLPAQHPDKLKLALSWSK
jgi:hypothetical protein